jgi:hypothetical protein
MSRIGTHTALCMAIAATLSSSACGGNASADAAARAGQPAADKSALPPLLAKPLPNDACGWFGASDVEATVGPVAGAPTVVRSAERPRPQADGNACLYRLAQQPSQGTGSVAIEVSVGNGVIAENVMGATRGRLEPWDYATPIPMGFMGRQGHVAITVTAQTLEVPRDKLQALAARVLGQVSDQPYLAPVDTELAKLIAESGGDDPRKSSDPDPCTLLTTAEAEAVLGRLTVPPYRSPGQVPLADPNGTSCSYYTAKHRAFTIEPTWVGGKTKFSMAKAVGGMAAPVLGNASTSPSPAAGPWDAASSSGTTGALYFLNGDRMLEVQYRTSSTDVDGAARLAKIAMGRMVAR